MYRHTEPSSVLVNNRINQTRHNSDLTVKKPDKGDERQKFLLDDRINRFNLALHELLIWSIKT